MFLSKPRTFRHIPVVVAPPPSTFNAFCLRLRLRLCWPRAFPPYRNIVANEYLKFLGKNPMEGDDVFREAEKTVGDRGHEAFEEY